MSKNNNTGIQEYKLKRMKLLSTGLLIFVTILYFIFKKLQFDQSHNLFLSSLVAFCEASMVGALADWFAVVALFKHPLGMSWIPHTAIIKKNKKQIGDSLANFVVDNFFTDENIDDMLKNIRFSETLDNYVSEKKEFISNKIVKNVPDIAVQVFNDETFKEMAIDGLDNTFEKVKLSQTAGTILEKAVISTGNNITVVKTAIQLILKEVGNNRESIISFIQKQKVLGFFTIPESLAEKIYNDIYSLLDNEIQTIDNDIQGAFSKTMLDRLEKIAFDLKNSKDFINKGETLKENFLKSEVYNSFKNKNLWDMVENNLLTTIISGFDKNAETINEKVINYIDVLVKENFRSEEKSKNIDKWARKAIASIVSANKVSIGESISKTVHEWPENDVVEKLELQVGSDLQYIRINGTLVGGLFGVVIHLVSSFLM